MSYAGDVNAKQAYEILKNEKNSYLIDVRTLPEWTFSGVPSLAPIGKEIVTLSYMFYPRMDLNENFAEKLQEIIPDKNSKLFFLCKVGGRSLLAAKEMTKKGYMNSYNISDGFEGALDENNQRGHTTGWKASALPWEHP